MGRITSFPQWAARRRLKPGQGSLPDQNGQGRSVAFYTDDGQMLVPVTGPDGQVSVKLLPRSAGHGGFAF